MLTSLKRVDIGRNLKAIWVNEAPMFLKISEEMFRAFLGLVKLLAYFVIHVTSFLIIKVTHVT